MKQPKLYKMKKYIIGIWMALLPIGVMLAQTDSTRTVKDTKRATAHQKTEIGCVAGTSQNVVMQIPLRHTLAA